MHRTGIAVGRNLIGTINEFIDPFSIGDGRTIFGQWFGNGDIVNFLEPACPLSFKSA